MPDNLSNGKLENFIQTLIPEDDPIYSHTIEATAKAKSLGAQFRDVDRDKAILHAWLAWQDPPGPPYGVAIKAERFRHDSPLAQAFVSWYRELYEISD